jgi:hypothetical protein
MHFIPPFGIVPVIVDPHEEGKTRTLLIPHNVLLILGENVVVVVEDDLVLCRYSLQSLYARNHAVLRRLGALVPSVRGEWYVGVDNDCYFLAPFCRCVAWIVISATSPIWSPKKFLGQFLM